MGGDLEWFCACTDEISKVSTNETETGQCRKIRPAPVGIWCQKDVVSRRCDVITSQSRRIDVNKTSF